MGSPPGDAVAEAIDGATEANDEVAEVIGLLVEVLVGGANAINAMR
jgi:hypothetical protein